MPIPPEKPSAVNHAVDRPRALAAAVLLTGIGALGFNVLPLLIGAAADVFGSDERRLGILGSVFISGKTLMYIALIILARRVNWRITCGVLCVAQIFAFLATTKVYGFTPVAISLFVGGFCLGGLFGLGSISIADTRSPDRNFGWATLAQVLMGAVLTYFLSKAVIPVWGYNGIMISLAASGIVGLLLAQGMAPRGVTGMDRSGMDRSGISSGSKIIPIAGLFGLVLFYFGVGAIWSFLERIAIGTGLTREFLGTVVSGSLVAGGISCLVPVILADRMGRRLPIVLSAFGLCMTIAIFTFNLTEGSFLAVAMIFNSLWTIMAIYAIAVISVKDPTGWYVVAIPAALGLGQAIGPLVGGFAYASFGVTGLCILSAVMVLLSLGIFISITREPPKPLLEPA
jgi:predicted MFS family arabinose efflux permease